MFLQPSSDVSCLTLEASCRTGEPLQNFDLNPLFNSWGYTVLIPMMHSFFGPHQEDVQALQGHVNSIRPSIQFTMEKEQSTVLDVLMTRKELGFRSSTYCCIPGKKGYNNTCVLKIYTPLFETS